MYSPFQLATKYFKYYITASNGKGHGVHSPFVFDFISHVLNDKRDFYAYQKVEALRESMIADKRVLEIDDFGAGSADGKKKQRLVSEIARRAAKPKKLGQLLFRIVNYYQPKYILELGTSLGLTTSYLAQGNQSAEVITIEGAPAVAELAKENFVELKQKNIKLLTGNFDDVLGPELKQIPSLDLAFIDGNHRKQPTLNYFNQLLLHKHEYSILIFDDIHWSKEMEEAWEEIKVHNEVTLSIDLFFIGLVFFRKEFKVKQHFNIRF